MKRSLIMSIDETFTPRLLFSLARSCLRTRTLVLKPVSDSSEPSFSPSERAASSSGLSKFWEVQFLRTLQIDTAQVLVPSVTNAKHPEQECPLFETFTNGIYLEKLDWYNRCSKPSIKQISNCSIDASLFGYTTFVDTPLDKRNWNVLQSCIIGNGEILTKDTNTIVNLLELV